MALTNDEIAKATDFIVADIGEGYKWAWDERKNMRFSKFASNRTEPVSKVLKAKFPHQWDYKTIKKAPKLLKAQLGDLAKLNKQQIIFTSPATEQTPLLIAAWWPWEHGATVSVRLTALDGNYVIEKEEDDKDSLFTLIKKLFS